jgi:LexA-binding, inner membrane-associated putative hydrolase
MELLTYLLMSLALARAAGTRLPRFGMAMLVTSGIAADLDFASYFFGASAFLRFHRTVLHSVPGSFVMCCVIAAAFCLLDRAGKKDNSESAVAKLGFGVALVACIAGAAVHLVLDLAGGIGVRLWWPFRDGWQSRDLLPNFDVWILLLLAGCLSLPYLGRLVSQEIGERRTAAPGRRAAVVTLVLIFLYIGGRGILHSRAMDLLRSRDYDSQPPQNAGAFPSSSNPFAWRGLVSTPVAIEELNISLLPGGAFDPDRAISHYKPDQSAAIAAAQNTGDGKEFLNYARFPLATTEPVDTGFDVTLRDLRFPAHDTSIEDVQLDVRINANSQIVQQRLRFAGSARER